MMPCEISFSDRETLVMEHVLVVSANDNTTTTTTTTRPLRLQVRRYGTLQWTNDDSLMVVIPGEMYQVRLDVSDL